MCLFSILLCLVHFVLTSDQFFKLNLLPKSVKDKVSFLKSFFYIGLAIVGETSIFSLYFSKGNVSLQDIAKEKVSLAFVN